MLLLADWAQRIVTFRAGDAAGLVGAGLAVQDAPGARHDDLPALPVQPPGACVERFRHVAYLFRPLSDGAQPPAEPAAGHNQPRQPGAGV
jgi:nitrate reductase gamma subunit